MLDQNGFDADERPRGLLAVAARADVQEDVRHRELELVEEDVRHRRVVVLAGVDEQRLDGRRDRPQCAQGRARPS